MYLCQILIFFLSFLLIDNLQNGCVVVGMHPVSFDLRQIAISAFEEEMGKNASYSRSEN